MCPITSAITHGSRQVKVSRTRAQALVLRGCPQVQVPRIQSLSLVLHGSQQQEQVPHLLIFLKEAPTDKFTARVQLKLRKFCTSQHVQQLNRDPTRVASGSNHQSLRLGCDGVRSESAEHVPSVRGRTRQRCQGPHWQKCAGYLSATS